MSFLKALEGTLIRPQGKRMIFPYTIAGKISQFPYRYTWNEAWHVRYMSYAFLLVVAPLYWKISKKLTSPENKAYWREKRKHDREHHQKELEKKWEIRT